MPRCAHDVEEVPVIYEEEEDKHATLNKLAIARMFKTTMAHGSAMDVLTALEDLNQKLKIAAGATDPEGVAHKLRTPLFVSVIIVGVAWALHELVIPEHIMARVNSILMTTAILLWAAFAALSSVV